MNKKIKNSSQNRWGITVITQLEPKEIEEHVEEEDNDSKDEDYIQVEETESEESYNSDDDCLSSEDDDRRNLNWFVEEI